MNLKNEERLRPFLVPVLKELVDDVTGAAAGTDCELMSAALFGSAVGKDFVRNKSDVNVLLVFDRLNLSLLGRLRGVFNKYLPKLKARPVVIDREYIGGSTDVFPMEFLEWKERNILIFGEELLGNIEVSLGNLRLEIEENLRGKKLRLVQSYFETPPGKGRLQNLLEAALPNFIVVFRNLLRLTGEAIPDDTAGTFRAVGELCGARLSNIARIYHIKSQGLRIREPEMEILFKGYLQEIDGVIEYVDRMKTPS